MILFLISFVAGILTVLAPCVLPLLPVIVGGSIAGGGGYRRAVTISASLGLSVVAFTLLLKVSTLFINVPPDVWQYVSAIILVAFGLVMIFPQLWDSLPFVNRLNIGGNKLLAAGSQKNSLWGDVLMGAALGPVFASCSPTYFLILATVLPASFAMGIIDLLAYAVGLSGFLLLIAVAGQRLVDRLGVTIEPHGYFRRGLGVVFIVLGVLIATGVMQKVEAYLIEKGFDATRLEHKLLGAPDMPINSQLGDGFLSPAAKASVYKAAPEITAPDGFINTPNGGPVTLKQYHGRAVVLIDIWTYSCINCQRTIPHLRDWYAKYKEEGLEIIGVHTPEFAFEKLLKNVENATKEFGITWPVVLDNDYRTWTAYGNQYWPRKYLIDIDGYIVYDHIGEGGYKEMEAAIQHALAERAERLGLVKPDMDLSTVEDTKLKVSSPEIYFGASRNEHLGNSEPFTLGERVYTLPARFTPNTLYLSGTWNTHEEYAENTKAGAAIRFYYGAKDVYMVGSATKPVRVKVTRDGGKSLGGERGADVSASGEATMHEDRLYKLIEGNAYGEHTLEIEILDVGLRVYTFTFG